MTGASKGFVQIDFSVIGYILKKLCSGSRKLTAYCRLTGRKVLQGDRKSQ